MLLILSSVSFRLASSMFPKCPISILVIKLLSFFIKLYLILQANRSSTLCHHLLCIPLMLQVLLFNYHFSRIFLLVYIADDGICEGAFNLFSDKFFDKSLHPTVVVNLRQFIVTSICSLVHHIPHLCAIHQIVVVSQKQLNELVLGYHPQIA